MGGGVEREAELVVEIERVEQRVVGLVRESITPPACLGHFYPDCYRPEIGYDPSYDERR